MHLMYAPFTSTDLAPSGDGWCSNGPGFIGVGTPKSGTSWWYSLLLQHPAIVPNRLGYKELAYFYHFGFRGPTPDQAETYRRAFDCPGQAISGEWSPSYLFYPCALEFLAEVVPDARILILLRNPIDRLWSHINEFHQTHVCKFHDQALRDLVAKYWGVVDAAVQSRYSPGVSRAFNYFGRSRVLVLQYERCRQDVGTEFRRTCRFLEREPVEPTDPTALVNESSYAIPPPGPAERAHLARYFHDDVHELRELTDDVDLRLWPDFVA